MDAFYDGLSAVFLKIVLFQFTRFYVVKRWS